MTAQSFNLLSTSVNIANSHLNEIAKSVMSISNDHWAMFGAIASFIVGFIAIYAANKDAINRRIPFLRPDIQIMEPFTRIQNSLILTRFKINNKSSFVAKNVSFWVENLSYAARHGDNWREASNFLPFPLRWTHSSDEHKDLLFGRPYHLDLCEIICNQESGQPQEITITTSVKGIHGGPNAQGLDDLRIGINKLQMTLYCENHPIIKYLVTLEWDGTRSHPKVDIKEL